MCQQASADLAEQPLTPHVSGTNSHVGIVVNAVPTFESLLAPRARNPFTGSMRIGILSPQPPTQGGLARFGAGLSKALQDAGHQVSVIPVADGPTASECVDRLNQSDVAVIQHHDEVYGGVHGDDLLAVLATLRVPSVLVAHSVPKSPAPHQRWVIEQIAVAANRVVVMSNAACERLATEYAAERAKIVMIPRGAAVPTSPRSRRASRPTILTWGFLREGKGIERVIDAMVSLRDVPGRPRYLVVGQTDPAVSSVEGEAYREALAARVTQHGLEGTVEIDGRFYDDSSLVELVQSVSAVVLPYDSTDKVTSGVLVDALVRGRPVVSTAFPYAVELLSGGAGIVVDHDDPDALVAALRRVLTQPRVAGAMSAEARRLAPQMAWPVVGRAYADLARQLLAERRVHG